MKSMKPLDIHPVTDEFMEATLRQQENSGNPVPPPPKPFCARCGKKGPFPSGLCKDCQKLIWKEEKAIAIQNVKDTLEQRKLMLLAKERELDGRVLAQLSVYEEEERAAIGLEAAEIKLGITLEKDVMMTPTGAFDTGTKIPEWKLKNLRDMVEFEIKKDKREIKDIEEDLEKDKAVSAIG